MSKQQNDWRPAIGTEVELTGDHPHAGKRGRVVTRERPWGRLAAGVEVSPDGGCAVFDPAHLRVVSDDE